MKQVEVLKECDIDGTTRAPGDIVETSDENAAVLIQDEFAKAVEEAGTEGAAAAPAAEEAATEQAAPAPRTVTQEDIDANPVLAELGAEAGDTVVVSKPVA